MAAYRVHFDVPSYKRQWRCGPLPKKEEEWVILLFSVWRGNLMMHTKIIAIRATIVQFWFRKHVQIHKTILVKMTCKSWKSHKNCSNRSQSLIMYFENYANQHFRFRFWIENPNPIIVALKAKILVCIIEVYTVTFCWKGWRWYYNDPQPAVICLIGPSWHHQNRLCSVNVVHSARSNQTSGGRRSWGQQGCRGEG